MLLEGKLLKLKYQEEEGTTIILNRRGQNTLQILRLIISKTLSQIKFRSSFQKEKEVFSMSTWKSPIRFKAPSIRFERLHFVNSMNINLVSYGKVQIQIKSRCMIMMIIEQRKSQIKQEKSAKFLNLIILNL